MGRHHESEIMDEHQEQVPVTSPPPDDRLRELSRALNAEVLELLSANGVRELDSYGWSGPDDVDPANVGHAMRQTDSLAFRVLNARMAVLQSQQTDYPSLTTWERFLIRSDGDFEGLMNAGRLAIGLALFEIEANPPSSFHANEAFQLHLISSIVTLGSASDRIRDFFIAANFQLNRADYFKGCWRTKGDRNGYVAPFQEAQSIIGSNSALQSAFSKIQEFAEDVAKFRRGRHVVVHDIATGTGSRHEEIANDPAPTPWGDLEFDYAEMIAAASTSEQAFADSVKASLKRSIDWYRSLVSLSNLAFVIENRLRWQRGRRL